MQQGVKQFLTDVLIPDPLFPALAIRRRYLAFSHTRNVERPQRIKRDSHSEEEEGEEEKARVRYGDQKEES